MIQSKIKIQEDTLILSACDFSVAVTDFWQNYIRQVKKSNRTKQFNVWNVFLCRRVRESQTPNNCLVFALAADTKSFSLTRSDARFRCSRSDFREVAMHAETNDSAEA